ncbi:amino acid adenylation domain-containing protein, partial [Myxococcaceae bacterium JPH2]|nr:amino acid adenylation domain-containing protein [Myxococcaceae bacterium JPH2]
LDERSNQLAHLLLSLGVSHHSLVALCLERSLDLVVALFATLKAGAAYVPLDSGYPLQRLAGMLEDSRPTVLLAHSHLLPRLPSSLGAHVLCLDSQRNSLDSFPSLPPPPLASPDSLAYVIFTSGSTGRPKGAMNAHLPVCNRLLWMQHAFHLSPSDVVLQKTPFSFDVSVWEFFWPLLVGARLVLARPGGHQEPAYLARLIRDSGVTTLHFVPSMLHAFLEEPSVHSCLSLRRIICSGEALPVELASRALLRLPSASLHNLYGPTEAAVDVTSFHCLPSESRRSIPIGRPVFNTHIRILDSLFSPVPPGVPGELFISGLQVGRGYLNRPDLTAERFLPDPFSPSPGARLYKTGDLARWLHDGNVEYLGRSDFQVKLRGLRIELGDIEAALEQLPNVLQSLVLPLHDASGSLRLVAYLSFSNDSPPPSLSSLRSLLLLKLPDFMLPASFVFLDSFPLSPSGKVDRKALPPPDASSSSSEYVPPSSPTEVLLASLWAHLLHSPRVGSLDHFFELGGHSLLATQLLSRIRDSFHVELPLRSIFEAPTLEAFARRIDEAQSQTAPRVPALVRAPRTSTMPLSFAQQRLWLIDQLDPGTTTYNMPVALRLSGALDVEALRRALEVVLHRHEVLRTTFRETSDGPVQVIAAPERFTLSLVDLRAQPETERQREARRHAETEATCPFSLTTGPLLRASLLLLAEQEHWLLLSLHHIVSDGWSMGVLVREL